MQLFDRTLGEAMADIARHRYPRDTAKHIARAWGIDTSTATNVVRGHCSERTLTKAFKAEGWALISAMGAVITGESYAQYEERKLQSIIEEGARARENLVRLHARREALESRAADLLHALDRPAVDDERDPERRTWREADKPRDRTPRRKSSARKA
jgi:ubiquinone biosynthesis protein UbiJ